MECHRADGGSMIVDGNEGNFEAEILRSSVKVIAYFYLPN